MARIVNRVTMDMLGQPEEDEEDSEFDDAEVSEVQALKGFKDLVKDNAQALHQAVLDLQKNKLRR